MVNPRRELHSVEVELSHEVDNLANLGRVRRAGTGRLRGLGDSYASAHVHSGADSDSSPSDQRS